MIEACIKRIESILKRDLTGEEVLIVGTAYQKGLIDGRKWSEDSEKAKRENTGEGEEEKGL